jgi:hypothetical protein
MPPKPAEEEETSRSSSPATQTGTQIPSGSQVHITGGIFNLPQGTHFREQSLSKGSPYVLTGGKNWQPWSIRTAQALVRAGYWSVISTVENPATIKYVVGTADMPSPNSIDPKAEGEVLSYLLSAVSDSLLSTVLDAATSAKAWRALQNTFRQRAQAMLNIHMTEMYQLKKELKESLEQYTKRTLDLRSRIRQADSEITDGQLLLRYLNGLPEAYHTETVIIMKDLEEGKAHSVMIWVR